MNIPYQTTDQTTTVFLPSGPKSVYAGPQADAVLAVIADPNGTLEQLENLLNPAKAIFEAVNDDDVTISGNTILYRGESIPNDLSRKIIGIVSKGLDPLPWRRFLARMFKNPSPAARAELGLFLEFADLPITPDGCFLAYKRVREDYTDVHSGTFDNSVGQVVTMPGGRGDVDPDRDNTCSYGLHFCSKEYLKSFGGARIVIVKIDPADVVAIPSDYANTKGRTWKYEVIGEIDREDEATRIEWGIIDYTYDYGDEDSWDDDIWGDEDDDEELLAWVDEATDEELGFTPEVAEGDELTLGGPVLTPQAPEKVSRLAALRAKFGR